MNDNQAFTIVLEYLLQDVSNKEYREKLNSILMGIKDFKTIEEVKHPRYQSILLFGTNIFPFSNTEYRKMAEHIQKEAR